MTKQPQDRKHKSDRYTFTVQTIEGGKPRRTTYRLPPASDAAGKVSGRFLRDAYMGGDEGEARLAFATLEAAVTDQAALDALYAMPAPDMLDHVKAWMEFKVDEVDASLGE